MNPWADFSVQLIISLSTLHCSTKWQTKKEPQRILYSAWKAKTQRYMSCNETACEDLLWGITTKNGEERTRIRSIPTTILLTGLRCDQGWSSLAITSHHWRKISGPRREICPIPRHGGRKEQKGRQERREGGLQRTRDRCLYCRERDNWA